jgi:hypothetical protein
MIKAAVISEDHTLDEYIVRPVVEQVFAGLGQRCRVTMVNNPRLRGVAQALDPDTLVRVLANYPMADVFLTIVDRDCDPNREMGRLANQLQAAADAGRTMFGCLAVEEVEVWALALHRDELAAEWDQVRSDCHPKENYFEPLARRKKWHTGPGKGRKAAMKELRSKWDSLKHFCPELRQFQDQLQAWLSQRA